MDSTSDALQTTKVSAEILFGVSLAFVLSIFLLNSSLADLREQRDKKDERYRALSRMVDRLHSFRAKNSEFFKDIVVASLETERIFRHRDQYPNLIIRVQTIDGSKVVNTNGEPLLEVEKSAEIFGAKAASAFKMESSPNEREGEFRALIAEAFKDDNEVALFINNEVVPKLAAIDTPAEWKDISSWIAFGEYPSTGGTYFHGGVGITFGKRFINQSSDHDDRFYIYKLLLSTPNQLSVDEELFSLLKQSYNEKRSSATVLPGVSLSLFGLSISADAVVAGAAPILIVLQFLFLIHWERRAITSTTGSDSFTFPSFACPNDPLNGPMPKTLGEAAQRLIWALFLIFPISILSVGLLTRYDLIYPLGYSGDIKTPLFVKEMWGRSDDWLSSILDWTILVCIFLSALTIFNITRTPSKSASGNPIVTRRIRCIAIMLAVICILATLIAVISNASSFHFNMAYFAAFGVLCSLCFGFAWQYRARFLGILSIVGLVVFFLHFVPF